MLKYLIVIEKTKSGYSAYAPDLPGCIATGKTKKAVERSMYEAVKFHLEGLQIPKTSAESEVFVFAE